MIALPSRNHRCPTAWCILPRIPPIRCSRIVRNDRVQERFDMPQPPNPQIIKKIKTLSDIAEALRQGNRFHVTRLTIIKSFCAEPCPRTGVSCPARTIQAPLICLSRGRRWRGGPATFVGCGARGQAFHARLERSRPRADLSFARPSARGQAFHARLERSRPRADLSFARSPLAGRPRLLGAAAHSGLYRDRTAGGAGDECMRSRQGGELARRPFHRMR
jgi:hypothetical protein